MAGAIKSAFRKRDLLTVTTQLAIMTKSGVDLASAFESLAQQSSNEHIRKVLSRIHEDVTGGKSVSEAMRLQADVFGDAYVASVAAGEAAGQLPEVLGRLAELAAHRNSQPGDHPHAAGLSDSARHGVVARW